jgi:hypothetical protein
MGGKSGKSPPTSKDGALSQREKERDLSSSIAHNQALYKNLFQDGRSAIYIPSRHRQRGPGNLLACSLVA